MSDFEQELKAGFLEEAVQLLAEAEQCFLELESDPTNVPNLEKIFRIAHNIKGSSKAVGFDALGAFTHEFESFLLKCKSGQMPITAATVSLLLACNDHLNLFIESLKSNPNAEIDSVQLVSDIQNFKAEDAGVQSLPEASSFAEDNPSIDSSVSQEAPPDAEDFGDDFASVEEIQLLQKASSDFSEICTYVGGDVNADMSLVSAPVAIANLPPASVLTEKAVVPKSVQPKSGAPAQADESIRVSLNRLERLLNFVGEMVILQTVLREQSYSEDALLFRRTIQQMSKVTKEVQDLSMSLRMIPLKQTFQKMQRIVRDTASALDKKVNLIVEGEETEVDKTVLESLSDPLVHLIRNAVDHGIESPSERLAKGKDEAGTVALKAYHQSGKLIIEVIDNGGGIPADRLRAKALEKGILKPGQTISDQEAIELVFHPGFSTKAQVTEVSGRGVGMDVVKTNIEKMQGEVLIETRPGNGSTFKIVLPLTMAIIDGMVVRCEGERFVIPRSHVHESIKLHDKDLQFATGTGEVLFLRGENLPVVRLAKALGRKSSVKDALANQIAIIVRTQGNPFAVIVDDIIGQHQVVIKKLGDELQNVKGMSGSAILGDGHPALILELGDLLSGQAMKRQGA
jgi:two-component system chemotaxis sensor kinase CheA